MPNSDGHITWEEAIWLRVLMRPFRFLYLQNRYASRSRAQVDIRIFCLSDSGEPLPEKQISSCYLLTNCIFFRIDLKKGLDKENPVCIFRDPFDQTARDKREWGVRGREKNRVPSLNIFPKNREKH